jgi:hypothetical protein
MIINLARPVGNCVIGASAANTARLLKPGDLGALPDDTGITSLAPRPRCSNCGELGRVDIRVRWAECHRGVFTNLGAIRPAAAISPKCLAAPISYSLRSGALVGTAVWLACGDAAAPLFYFLGALGIGVLSGCVFERLGQQMPRFDFFVGAIGVLLLIAWVTWRLSGAVG